MKFEEEHSVLNERYYTPNIPIYTTPMQSLLLGYYHRSLCILEMY